MKKFVSLTRNFFGGALILAAISPVAAASFFEDFESGLGQWTGRNGGAYHAGIILDPLASGRGHVLNFTNLASGGDLFSSAAISLSGPIKVNFDYLGMPSGGGTPGDLGGFFGIAYSLNASTEGTDLFWYAGTLNSYPGLVVNLIDDGAWHSYSFQLNASAMPAFRLMLEDYTAVGGVTCDVFFDNISVTPVPEPTLASFAIAGLLAWRYSSRTKRQA